MTPRENMLAFFAGQPYDWTPTTKDRCAFQPEDFPDNVCRGFVSQQNPFPKEKFGGNGWFGIQWRYEYEVNGAIDINRQLNEMSEWKEKIVFPDLDAYDWEGIAQKNAEYLNTDNIVSTTLFSGYFEKLIALMSFEDAAMAMIDPDSQDDVKSFFDALTDFYIEFVRRCNKYFRLEYVTLHDDWGTQRAPIFSKAVHAEMLLPYVKRFASECHKMGVIVDMHSCGYVLPIFDNFIESGVDTWVGQAIPGMKDELIKAYGDRFNFCVALSALEIPENAENKVDAAVENLKSYLAKHDHKRLMFFLYRGLAPAEMNEFAQRIRDERIK